MPTKNKEWITVSRHVSWEAANSARIELLKTGVEEVKVRRRAAGHFAVRIVARARTTVKVTAKDLSTNDLRAEAYTEKE